MFTGSEYENVRNLAKSLHEQMSATELCLMSFNDEFKKVMFKQYVKAIFSDLKIDPAALITFATQIGNMQAAYVNFKTCVEFMQSLIQP